jgi:hypothetical protein
MWSTYDLRSWVIYATEWSTQLNDLRIVRIWMIYAAGWSMQLGDLRSWVIYAAGWFTQLNDLRSWMIYAAGWSTHLGDLRSWVIYTSGWSTHLGGLRIWVVYASEWSGFSTWLNEDGFFQISWMRTAFSNEFENGFFKWVEWERLFQSKFDFVLVSGHSASYARYQFILPDLKLLDPTRIPSYPPAGTRYPTASLGDMEFCWHQDTSRQFRFIRRYCPHTLVRSSRCSISACDEPSSEFIEARCGESGRIRRSSRRADDRTQDTVSDMIDVVVAGIIFSN